MTERIAMLVTATTADELVCALRSINGPVSIDERVENDELIRIVVAGETVFTLVPFRAPEREAQAVEWVVDEGTVRSLERELERRAARIAALEAESKQQCNYVVLLIRERREARERAELAELQVEQLRKESRDAKAGR